jgi:beta-lactam-binding protein with PASTA domain
MTGKGLEGEPSLPTESGPEYGTPSPAGLAESVLDALAGWLAPKRERRVVRVPELQGMHVSETFLPALQAGIKLELVRVTHHPAPVDGVVVAQDPLPGTRVKRGSHVHLVVRHPEDRSYVGPP